MTKELYCFMQSIKNMILAEEGIKDVTREVTNKPVPYFVLAYPELVKFNTVQCLPFTIPEGQVIELFQCDDDGIFIEIRDYYHFSGHYCAAYKISIKHTDKTVEKAVKAMVKKYKEIKEGKQYE